MTALFTLLSIFLSAPAAQAQATLAEHQFAETRFHFPRPSVVRIRVQTCNSKGKVRAIQLLVKEGVLNLNSMVVEYMHGGREQAAGKLKLEKGKASAWIPVKDQESPCLQHVVLNVGASSSKAMTVVGLIGQWEQ